MRLFLRLLGWLLAAVALVLLAGDLIAWWRSGEFALRPVGQVWRNLDVDSLNGLQVLLERHVWPPLWSSVVFPVLLLPATLLFGGLALVCLALGHRRRSPRWIFRR